MNWICELDWDKIDVFINALQLLTFCVPATIFFIYHRFSVIEVWIMDIAQTGMKVNLHNKTNHSVYISRIVTEPSLSSDWNQAPTIGQAAFILPPDGNKELVIDYLKNSSEKRHLKVTISYNTRRKKHIKACV